MNTFQRILLWGLLGWSSWMPPSSQAELQLFACEPEWGALAREIGGDRLSITVATTASQDPHYVRAKPSLIAAVRRADLLLCSGASLEVGWLPVLLEKAGNSALAPTQPGSLFAADYVTTIDKPDRIDRAEGDVHPEGNPHLHLNPHNVARVAEELVRRLVSLDPDQREYYQQRGEDFSARWQVAVKGWEQDAKGLRGVKVVTHHRSFAYLVQWLDMVEVANLEQKPGIPPTSSHLEALLGLSGERAPRLILRAPSDPADASEWLARKREIPAVVLPYTVGGDSQSSSLFALYDRTIAILTKAVE